MATLIPLAPIKRKESDPDITSSIDVEGSSLSDFGESLIEKRRDSNGIVHLKSLGIFRLAAILFFMGYGGSYGVEGAISKGPPHYVLMSFMFAPFVWALPEALVTAELSSALPNVGGNILWAKKAFGTFLAWQSGFWSLLSIPSAVGIFPVMFVSNLKYLIPEMGTSAIIITHFLMIVVICVFNIIGLKSVGGGNIIFSVLVLTPFLLFVVVGLAEKKWDWEVLTSTQWDGKIEWQAMVTAAIWSCGGWTNGGQIAGEIHNPRKSFNFAILIVMGLTLTFSLIPLSIAICVTPTVDAWKQFSIGSWVRTAELLGGNWLRIMIAFGAMFSALGEMNSSFCAQARLLSYLASCDDFSFPLFFSKMHPTFHTPYIAIITLGLISFVVSLLDFQLIVSFVVFLASISIIITFLCLIRLRIMFPEMDRPFKVPFGKFGLVYTCGVGIVIATFNIINIVLVQRVALWSGIGLVGTGIILFYLSQYMKRKWGT